MYRNQPNSDVGTLKKLTVSLAYLMGVGVMFTAVLGTGLTIFIGE